jgi:hypothetical protein
MLNLVVCKVTARLEKGKFEQGLIKISPEYQYGDHDFVTQLLAVKCSVSTAGLLEGTAFLTASVSSSSSLCRFYARFGVDYFYSTKTQDERSGAQYRRAGEC